MSRPSPGETSQPTPSAVGPTSTSTFALASNNNNSSTSNGASFQSSSAAAPPAQPAVATRASSRHYATGIAAGAEDVMYKGKYKELKKKVREVEVDNDKLYYKILAAKRSIQRMKLERAVLYERLSALPPSPDLGDRRQLPSIHPGGVTGQVAATATGGIPVGPASSGHDTPSNTTTGASTPTGHHRGAGRTGGDDHDHHHAHHSQYNHHQHSHHYRQPVGSSSGTIDPVGEHGVIEYHPNQQHHAHVVQRVPSYPESVSLDSRGNNGIPASPPPPSNHHHHRREQQHHGQALPPLSQALGPSSSSRHHHRSGSDLDRDRQLPSLSLMTHPERDREHDHHGHVSRSSSARYPPQEPLPSVHDVLRSPVGADALPPPQQGPQGQSLPSTRGLHNHQRIGPGANIHRYGSQSSDRDRDRESTASTASVPPPAHQVDQAAAVAAAADWDRDRSEVEEDVARRGGGGRHHHHHHLPSHVPRSPPTTPAMIRERERAQQQQQQSSRGSHVEYTRAPAVALPPWHEQEQQRQQELERHRPPSLSPASRSAAVAGGGGQISRTSSTSNGLKRPWYDMDAPVTGAEERGRPGGGEAEENMEEHGGDGIGGYYGGEYEGGASGSRRYGSAGGGGGEGENPRSHHSRDRRTPPGEDEGMDDE